MFNIDNEHKPHHIHQLQKNNKTFYNFVSFSNFQNTDSSPVRADGSENDRRNNLRSMMTSPVEDFEPFDHEDEILGDTTVHDDEEDEGEELFGDNMEK